jgi:hypothetical protein
MEDRWLIISSLERKGLLYPGRIADVDASLRPR